MDQDTKRYEILMALIPVNISTIPFFYFNTEVLVRRFVYKNKLPQYFFSLLILFIVFLTVYYLLKDFLIDTYPVRIYDSRTLFAVFFILSTSTLYGFIIYLVNLSRINIEEREERLKSELSFLRSQISPHFIFNILNSIVYLIRTKSKNAESVTIELSNLIRYMLYESENKLVPLSKEIEYLRSYIELQKMRFGEDIEIDLTENGKSDGLLIEPMLLIPFVENAFKHGVGIVKNPKIIVELSISNEKYFKFRVINKKGLEKNGQKDPNSGIGIKNVKRRIELLYPEAHNLEILENKDTFEISLAIILKK
jgi:LytS/YehU family sensor histidine kinase